jgi:hypothetical protein
VFVDVNSGAPEGLAVPAPLVGQWEAVNRRINGSIFFLTFHIFYISGLTECSEFTHKDSEMMHSIMDEVAKQIGKDLQEHE